MLHSTMSGILVLWPEIEPEFTALEAQLEVQS